MPVYRNALTETINFTSVSSTPGVNCMAFSRPAITGMKPLSIPVNYDANITLQGINFKFDEEKIDRRAGPLRLFVSAAPGMFANPLSSYTLYTSLSSAYLSANYPTFNGIELTPTVDSKNIVTFTLPAPQVSGSIEIIVANNGGYGMLSPIVEEQPHGDLAALHNHLLNAVTPIPSPSPSVTPSITPS